MEDAERAELLARFDEIVSEAGDPAEAAACLTKVFSPWRVWLGDQGGWYAGRAFTAQEMAAEQATLRSWETARCGETLAAATGGQMRRLLEAAPA